MGFVDQHFNAFVYNIIKKLGISLKFERELKWNMIFILGFFHFFGAYWIYYYSRSAKWQTLVFAFCMFVMGALGITCGVHRLWTHRSYKATLPIRILLMIWYASSTQYPIYNWVRDHRVHHKFSDTQADPHNVNRGFFFSHIGWMMLQKNKLVIEKGRQIDMSDIDEDPVVMFDRRCHGSMAIFTGFILPPLVSILLWSEEWKCAVAWFCFIKFLVLFHGELTVNSLAHMFGYKPYNKDIEPTQNVFVAFIAMGEGWHNYHHCFPYDYKAAETFDLFNWSRMLISFWAKLGLAYDLKEASPELVKAVVKKNGLGKEKSISDGI